MVANFKISMLAAVLFSISFLGLPSLGSTQEEMSLEKAAQKSNNPVSDAWLLLMQNDLTRVETPDGDKWQNKTSIQPIMPVPIMDGDWNIVNRIIAGVVTAPIDDDIFSTDPFDGRTTGFTDTVYFALAAPNRDDGWIWGVGPTFIFPTASNDVLGQEKWQAGPAALLARLGNDHGGFGIEHFNIGVLAQHWWDYAGDDDRTDLTPRKWSVFYTRVLAYSWTG
jgi:hypothetical protein